MPQNTKDPYQYERMLRERMQQAQQGRTQPSKQFMHVKPPITDCFAIKRTSNSYAMSRYARKGP